MDINIENDRYFIELIQKGILKVYKDGRVKNLKTGNFIGSQSQVIYK